MALIANNATKAKAAEAKDKFILGGSECYFEPANAFNNKLTAAVVEKLLLNTGNNENMSTLLQESNGKSLKLTLTIDHGGIKEVQHLGLVTASDFSMELDAEHCSPILDAVKEGGIIKRTSVDDLLGMFA